MAESNVLVSLRMLEESLRTDMKLNMPVRSISFSSDSSLCCLQEHKASYNESPKHFSIPKNCSSPSASLRGIS